MASIKFSYQCPRPHSETSAILTKALQEDPSLKKLDGNIQFDGPDSTGLLKIKGSQFTARVHLTGDTKQSNLDFNIEVPFLLLPFKSKIEESVRKSLDKHLA